MSEEISYKQAWFSVNVQCHCINIFNHNGIWPIKYNHNGERWIPHDIVMNKFGPVYLYHELHLADTQTLLCNALLRFSGALENTMYYIQRQNKLYLTP